MGFSLDDYIHKKGSVDNQENRNVWSKETGGFSLDRYIEGKRSPAPDLNSWFQDTTSALDSISKQAEAWKNTYKSPSEIDTSVSQYTQNINDLIRRGLRLNTQFSENRSVYDANYGDGTSTGTIEDINTAIGMLEKTRQGLSQERDFRNSLSGEKEFQDYLIASGDEAAAESVMSSLEQAKSANEKTLAELNKQLDEFQWGDKTVAEIISGRKAIKDQIKELEEQQKSIQDQYSRYYYTIDNREKLAAIKEDPDANALYESADVLRSDIDKVNAIADEVLFNKGNPKVPEYKQYLNEKYGLTEEAIKNFDIGGGGFKYSENGYGNLWQLYEELENQLNATKGQLSEKGYDYDRIIGYEQSLEDAEEYRKKQKEWEQYADKDFLSGLSASISSVIMSPFQGLDYIRLWINNAGHNDVNDLENYVPLNVYDMDATNYVSTIRSTVSKNIEESTDWNLFGENVASFLYQTGMSVADSMAQVATFGSGAVFLMGASAASNQAKNVIERGGSNSQAFWGGLAAGAAEVLFEKISIDRLLKTKHVTGWKSILKDKIKQSGVEASEEMLTEIANILSDTAIMGESSDFSMAVQAYQEQGLSETEAKKQAFLDCVGQVAKAGVGGALSGLVMGGASGVINMANRNVDTRSVGNQILRSGEIDLTIDEGLKLDSSDPLYKLAEELAERQNQGKTLSPKKVGQLEIGLETKALEQIESLRNQMAQGLDGDAQNGAETAPLGTVYTKPETVQNRPSSVQYGNPANTASDTNAPVSFNVEAATPMDAQARMGNTNVTVQGVASVRDGDVTVALSDGTNVPLYDVEIADPQIRQLYDTASKYDTNTARAFVSGFDGSLPISTYQTAFDYFMTQAKHGVPMGEAIQYAGLAGQMMSPVSVQTAYFAGENLQSSGTRGNMGAENGTMGGMKNVSVRQDTGSVLGRRRFQSDNGRIRGKNEEAGRRGNEGPGVRETTGREQISSKGRTTKAEGGKSREVDKRRYIHREIRASESSDAALETISFDEVGPELYSKAQKHVVEVGKKYGKTVYYVRRGDPINIGGRIKRMKGEAFTIPGTDIVFAAHDTKADFIHHELFHQFLALNRHQEELFLNETKFNILSDSEKFKWYKGRAEIYYPQYISKLDVMNSIIIEEITCDLCEYAMSGSEKMYNRLNGLFEGDTLETLAEQARGVFEANREAAQKNAAAETGGGTRYYLEGYTDHQKENWAGSKSIVVYESDAQLEQFIDDALNKRNLDKKMYFGRVPSDLAQRVMDETGMDIDGYNCTIQAQEIRKILVHSHGNETFERARGQRAITKEDIMNIPEVISSPDSISLSRKLYEGKPVIRFSKTINGRTTVVSYVSRKHRDLAVQTMYTSTKKGSLATATDAPASGPLSLTPETTGGTASNNSIGENPSTVNTSIPKRSKRDTESRYYLDEEHDSEGRRLTKEQADFFKDSKVRLDDDGEYWYGEGNLMPVYHATSDDFTVFDRGKLGENTDSNANDEYLAATAHVGFWFNSQEDMGVKMGVSRVEKVYLNITRPYEAGTVEGLASEIAGTEGDTPYEKGENFADWLSWNGYDGVMVRDEEFGGLSFVALRPDQIKRVDNNTPTSDPDIRFYMDDAVEEVKDLVAVHNLSSDNLESAFGLGGFPMPSIAVTKADMGHDEFGDISLIFDKETINPADRRNKVYGGDTWTPSFPKVEYKISDKKASDIRRRIDKLVDSDIQREFRLALDPYNIDDMVNRRGGDAVEAYRDNDAMRLAFLRDEGIAFEADVTDRYDTRDKLNELFEQHPEYETQYRKWLKNLFDGVVEKKGIRNNKDPFTPSGNRRSFESLHDEYTLENIVKSMKGDAEKGGALFHSASTVAAASTREYGSISEIKQDKGRLSRMTENEQEAVKKGFEERLSDIVSRMTSDIKGGNIFSHISNATEAITGALAKRKTATGIKNDLKSWGQFTVTDEIVSDILSLSEDMANAPTTYFEAKPQRAVGFEEVKAAIIPDTLDGNLKNQLEAAGIKTVEYKAGDNADRVRALNEAPELRFFLEDVSPVDVDLLTEENQTLREQVNTLREEFKLTKGHKAKPGSLEKLADSILKETRSSYDKGTLVKNLEALFDYIANDPDSNFDEAMDVSVDVANSVLRESSDLDSSLYDHYKDMREYFRKTAISLPQDIRSGMDYERFRKEHFGGIRLTNDGASLDSLWPEISGKWPEFFSPDTPIQEQPQAVADALRTVKPSYVNPYGMDSTEAAYDLAMRMYEEYFNIPEIHTFADKKKAELNQLRAKYENRIHAIRKGYEAREQALIQEQRQKRKDLKDENRLRLAAQMEKVREQRKAASAKRQESALVRRYKPRIIRDTMELGRWLTHPTDKKHVPEPFRKAVAEFVNTIDFSSNRLNSKGKPTMRTLAMQKLSNQMNTIPKSESGTFEEAKAIFESADPDLIPNMADLIQNAERVRIEDMTGAQLGELAHVVSALKSMLTNANNLIAGEQTRQAETVAQGIHLDLAGHKNAREYTWPIGFGKRLMSYDMMDAPSYFEELGGTAYNELYRPLRRAFDRKIRNTAEAVAYMQRLLKGVDTDTWSGPKAKKHTFKVKGGTVSLNTAQIMSLYELSKRDQARGHILGGGIRPSDTVKGTRIDKAFRPITMTAQDLAEIVGTLTPEQRMVADGIADFFKTTAEWGNEVSMKLYGYRKFTEPNYFPIVSDKNYTTTMQGDPKHQDAILKNLGMTKSTVIGANNPIMVEDIFDVFTRQADQMGSYNAFVVPLADMNKVINFKASDPGGEVRGSVKESIERALGHDAISYWNKLVEDINGVSKQTPPTIGDKLLSNMKAAAVGANLRVIIQQPTAYLRAAALIDPKYLAKGLAAKSDIDEMNQYAPIAYWKDLGFFEMDTARGMKDILMNRNGLRDIAMKPASWADSKTWGKLWNAVKAEIQDTTDLNPGSVEFLEAAGERFSEIIDRTQVVDSVLHRSQMMRSEKFIDKTVTSFMSEPTKSYNMLRSAVRDVQKNGWKRAGKRLVRVAVAHTVTSIATALAAALIDAMRDDDKEKSWAEKYLSAAGENTLDNLSPLNMLPYLRDAASLLSGYSLTRQEMAGLTDVVNAGRNWVSYFQGDSKYSIAWLIKNSAASISKLTGIPVAAATREFEALIRGGIQALDKIGVPTTRMEYILDTFYYPVIPKNASRYAQYVYDAYKEDNTNLAQDVMGAMNEGGIDDDKIGYYMRKILRGQDERIAEAGKAKMDGNMSEYAEIVREISREGFSQDWIVGAVDGWISSQKNAEKEASAPSEKVESESKSQASLFENSDVVTSLEAGNLSEAKTVIQDLLSNGKEESSIRSSITRHYKPVYQDLYRKKDEAGMRRIREMLVDLGIGYKSGDFTRWIQDMN